MKTPSLIFTVVATTGLFFGGIAGNGLSAAPQNPKKEEQRSQTPRRSEPDSKDPRVTPNPIDPSQQTVRPGQPALPEQVNPARTPPAAPAPQDPSRPDIPGQVDRSDQRTYQQLNTSSDCCKRLDAMHTQMRQHLQALQARLSNLKDSSDRAELQTHVEALSHLVDSMDSGGGKQNPGTGPDGAKSKTSGKKRNE